MNAAAIIRCLHAILFGLSLLVLGLVCGCLIIPTPEHDSGEARSNFHANSLTNIQPGLSRFEDVLLTFGEPDAVSADERRVAFRSQKIVAYWIIVGGYNATGGALTTDHYWLVELDERGFVRSSQPSSRWSLPKTPGDLLETKGWKTACASASNQPARLSGPAYWFPHADGFQPLALSPGEHARGFLELTDTCLRFHDRTQQADTAPQLSISYESLTECRLADFGFGRRVVIRTRNQHAQSFAFEKNKLNPAAYEFIRARLTDQNTNHVIAPKS